MIKAIIIEDEKYSREVLQAMLYKHFGNISVVAVCTNAADGKAAIEQLQPDLIFSDIELENKPVEK